MLSAPPLFLSPESKFVVSSHTCCSIIRRKPLHFFPLNSLSSFPKVQNPILFQKKTNIKMDHLILSLLLLLVSSKGVSGATFTVVNSCDYTVWPGIITSSNKSRLDSTGFELPRQSNRTFRAPTGWAGRFWGRTGCNFNESGSGSCQTGDCGSGTVECNGAGAAAPATLVEFALATNGLDFYDVSIVDGYNLAVSVEGTGGSGQCPWTGCSMDINLKCPPELKSDNGSTCLSACWAFRTPYHCCVPPYGSPSTCRSSVYSDIFKDACPKAYSYAYDDAGSSFTCTTGADYTVTFCPLSSQDNLVPGKSLSANQTLTSFNGTFALGFFSPESSSKYFLGIWYNTVPANTAIVWVANRESPLDSPGVFALGDDGNLVVLDESGKVMVWSSNVSVSAAKNSTTGLLMDTGNLVLLSGNETLWESFDHPSDTMLPGMKISFNKRTGQQRRLTSWAAVDDPQPGNFTLGIDPKGPAQFFIWNENTPYVRGASYIGKETNTAFTVDGENEPSRNGTAYFLTYKFDADEAYLTYGVSNSSVRFRFRLNPNGQDELLLWMDNSKTWFSLWKQPVDNCDFYAHCGPYGSCHRNETLTLSSPCKCLTGFRPKFQKQWDMGNWSGGCVREKPLRCDNRTEGYFEKFERLKLPDQSVLLDNRSIIECKSECSQNCSCTTYAYVNSTEGSSAGKCLTWFDDLMDVVENQTLGANIYVRLQGVPHGNSLKRSLVIALVSAIAGLITIIFGFFLWKKTWGKEREYSEIIRHRAGGGQNDIELPLFSLKSILAATNNFSEANKLGEGGFGPVYKGILHVHEVAIKRLSKKSGQGHQEFMNELKLIANLQHTNLVRLLGCCVEDEEQILVYEYMPNRSLDKFLFDPSENTKLDWDRRFHIIEGIAQGVLYIHKYSRLKIIHRDLKASNVLLDGAMNPKISDFGMAKIFEINQTEANTNRVVGTYGYMSPEYARYGHFSEKSDVFSFGVLLLEIISGKKNASFYHYEHSLTLAGWAWKLWKEGRGMEVIDASVRETCQPHEALRCIHVGFLCVQESPADRPTMSSVVHMLQANEGTILPPSKEPAFSTHRNSCASGSSSQPPTIFSVNSLTISTLEGR